MIKVSIIGTAGRGATGKQLNKEIYNKMVLKSKQIIEKQFLLDPKKIELVSGGAAWSDHIAISLYLEGYVKKATLYLPAEFDTVTEKYVFKNNQYDPGKISNYYHSLFSKKMGKNTLHEINLAIEKGITLNVGKGFKNRNTQVAKSEYMIAYTFGEGNEPADGGTSDTWLKSISDNKVHVSLKELEVEEKTSPRIGFHLNTTAGFVSVIDYAKSLDINFFQIFLGSPRSYKTKPKSKEDLIKFNEKLIENDIKFVVHGNYLLNFCNSKNYNEKIKCLVNDMKQIEIFKERCLGVIIHMGSNVKELNLTVEEATLNYVNALKYVLSVTSTILILETGAGEGREICTSIPDLGKMYKMFNDTETTNKILNRYSARVGVGI